MHERRLSKFLERFTATASRVRRAVFMPKILIVDDSSAELEFMATILRMAGHQVALASNGVEALRCFEPFSPDLVITDIYMPDCDGIELLLHIRRSKSQVPVLAISGGCAREQGVLLSMMPQLGADLALAKPLSTRILLTAVESLLARADSIEQWSKQDQKDSRNDSDG
jgi:DNA-binding response OmpR family regulator